MNERPAEKVSIRRRIAALVSLICFVLLASSLVVLLVRHVEDMTIGLLGLCIAAAGAWWIVTERMPRRAFGMVGLTVGFAAIAVAIGRAIDGADRIALWIILVTVLLVIMIGLARVATMPDAHRVALRVRASGPPRHAVLLCNPWSGGGKVERFGLVDLAAHLGVETVLLDHGLDLEHLARDAVARGADCLGMAGGDGSQALVASIAIEHKLPFVCVSAGTRNHFALDLGLNREDPRGSMQAFRDAVERTVDCATVNGRVFVNNVSLGVYAQIVQEQAYRDAKLETTKLLLPEVLGRQAAPLDLQFTTPSRVDVEGAILIMVSNNPYVIGASPDSAQRRRLDSGELGVFAVTTSTGAAAAALFAATALGQRRRSPYWHEFTTTSFEVRSRSGEAFAGVDGEALHLPTPLRFEILPRGLTLLVPAGNVEIAERRRTRDVTLADLMALAVGHQPRRGH
jgi:diacylglycerol kinase family enzyme